MALLSARGVFVREEWMYPPASPAEQPLHFGRQPTQGIAPTRISYAEFFSVKLPQHTIKFRREWMGVEPTTARSATRH